MAGYTRPDRTRTPGPTSPPAGVDHDLRLVTLAPLTWAAGHDVLLAAVAELAGHGLLLRLDVLAEGGVDVHDRERLLFTAHDLGVAAATVLHVAPSRAARQRLLANADVFVLAALDDRPWPELDEAATHTLAVAASDLPSVRARLSPAPTSPGRATSLPHALADAVVDLAAGIRPRAASARS